ncbi:MAG: hypothetical protein WAW73_19630 [Rhodoferax sp.]
MAAEIGIKLSATDNTRAAFDSVGRNMANLQTAAASVAGSLASIGVGFSVGALVSMTKQIVDGIDAMNDLKDATGASIENISALEDVALRTGASFDTVSTALVKLNQGLNSAKAGSETEAAIKLIGLSIKELKELDPAEAFRQIAVALSAFDDDGKKARLTQELFGKSLKEVAPLLKDLAEQGSLVAKVTTQQAEEAEKFNKELAQMSKNTLDIARSMTGPLVSAFNETIAMFREGAKEGKSYYRVLVDEQLRLLGLKDGPKEYAQRLSDISAILQEGNIHQSRRNALLREQAALQSKMNVLPDAASDSTEMARLARFPKPSVGDLPDSAAIRAAAAASAKALAEQNRELAAQAKLIAENAGLSGSFAEDWNRLAAIYKRGALNLGDFQAAQAKLLANQPAIKAANDAEAKAAEVIEKANRSAFEARLKYVESLEKGLAGMQADVQKQQEYNDKLGMSKEAMAALDAAKLESQAITLDLMAIKEQDKNLDQEQADIYRAQAAELRKLAALKGQGALKEAAIESAKDAAEEWKRGWAETDRLARDVFTTWATEGGNAGQKIGDTLKKALLSAIYEATLKPIVFEVYAAVMGGTAGSSSGSAGGGSSSKGQSVLSWLTNFEGNATTSFQRVGENLIKTGNETLMDAGASIYNNAATYGKVVNGAGTVLSYLNAIDLWTQGKRGAAIGAGVGQYFGGPIGSAIGQFVGSKFDYTVEPKGNAIIANVSGKGASAVATRTDFTQKGGWFGGGETTNSDWADADAGTTSYIDQSIKNVTASNKAYAEALGLNADAMDGYTQQIEINTTGMDSAAAQAAIDAQIVKFQSDMISSSYGDALSKVAIKGETSAQTMERLATNLVGANSVMGMLGSTLFDVSTAGAAAASGLVQAMGGMAQFQAQMSAYYQSYYTEAEQRANIIKGAQADLNAAGITGYTTEQISGANREQIRQVVEMYASQKDTAEGAARYAAVIKVANSLSGVTPALNTIATEKINWAGTQGASGSGSAGGGGEAAASSIADAWAQITESIWDEVKRIRGLLEGTGETAFAAAQARFSVATAMARAGDQTAASKLPELSQNVLALAETNSRTLLELQRTRARTSGSLSDTASLISAQFGLSIPHFAGGGVHAGGWAMVGERGPELAYMPPARIYNAADTQSMFSGQDNTAMVDELKALRQEVTRQREELRAIRLATENTSRITEKSDSIGPAPARASV